MSRRRVGWVVVAVLIGSVAALVGNWWTVFAMVCLVVDQVAGERKERRRSSKVEPASVPE